MGFFTSLEKDEDSDVILAGAQDIALMDKKYHFSYIMEAGAELGWIIVIVLCVAGVACGAAAYFMGGQPDALYQNSVAAPVLELFDPTAMWSRLAAFFGW